LRYTFVSTLLETLCETFVLWLLIIVLNTPRTAHGDVHHVYYNITYTASNLVCTTQVKELAHALFIFPNYKTLTVPSNVTWLIVPSLPATRRFSRWFLGGTLRSQETVHSAMSPATIKTTNQD